MSETNYRALASQADAAGRAAAEAVNPRPMTVVGGGQEYFVADGVCGFAWVVVKPGNSPFARFAKQNLRAHKHYYGGVEIWVSGYGQSMQRKEAYASAYADVLRNAGIQAYSQSRMD